MRSKESIKDVEYVTAPRFGKDLALSLDLRLQFFAYRELKSAIEEHHAKSGSVVMLDAHTGEILALVNDPSFNPNELTRVAPDARRNRAITDLFEPGSTVKPLTVLAALESGRFDEDSVIDTTPGYMRVGRLLVQDPVNRGRLSLGDVLARSSQVGIAKIALALDDRMVFDAFVRAGLSEMTSCGLARRSHWQAVRFATEESDRSHDARVRIRADGDAAAARAGVSDAGERRRSVAGLDPATRRSANGSA